MVTVGSARSGLAGAQSPLLRLTRGCSQVPRTVAATGASRREHARGNLAGWRPPSRPTMASGGARMEVLVTRCAGLDVHKKTVVVCALVGEADAVGEPEV